MQSMMTREHYPVKYEFAYDFKQLAEQNGCIYKNMVELICCKLLLCILDVPEEKKELIDDMAFMTIIKNPKFQKYYDLTKLEKKEQL